MNTIKSSLLAVSFLMLHTVCYAASSFYCPTNYGTIRPGMSQSQVIKFCGQPTSKTSSESFVSAQIPAVQNFYRVGGNTVTAYNLATARPQSGSGRTIVLGVTFVNNKVTSMSVNGSSSQSISMCNGNIQVGDSLSKVNSACGRPYAVNRTTQSQGIPKKVKNETWFYQFSPYHSVTLTFQGGVLKSISN